jgi:hypothetical protein
MPRVRYREEEEEEEVEEEEGEKYVPTLSRQVFPAL